MTDASRNGLASVNDDPCTHPWAFAVEPFRMAGSLYYVGNSNVSSHLIDTGEGLILLDTAFPQTVYLLLESIRRLDFDPADIAYILHSHAHYDHCGGTRAIKELTGAKTFLGAGDLEVLTDRPELSWAREYGFTFHETFDVDVALEGGEVVSLGNTSIECVHTPGHTAGTISWFFEVVEGGRRCTVGAHGGPGLNTLGDGYLTRLGLPLSRRNDYLRSLHLLRQRRVDIFAGIHPGQSNTLDRAAARSEARNPFIAPDAWPRFLQQMESRFTESFG